MSDDVQPETPPAPVEAPNIIDDTLPGGARWMHNLGDEPVWVETKTQLKQEMEKRGLVFADTKTYNKHDESPWATRTRLKAGHIDPFLPKEQPRVEPPPTEPAVLYDASGKPLTGSALDYATASTLRTYFSWVVRAQYEPELFCAQCRDHRRGSKATYDIDELAIDVWCRCRRVIYAGATKFEKIVPTLPPSETPDGAIHLGPAQLSLSLPEAQILRAWKQVLHRFGFMEGLRCNFCFEANHPDGVEGQVFDARIRIACRCRVYTFVGYSY